MTDAALPPALPPLDPRVQALLDKQEITEVIYKYCRALDRSDERLMREEVFHEDGTDDHGLFKLTAKQFCDFVFDGMTAWERTQHRITNVLIDLHGDVAYTDCYFVAWHLRQEGEGARMRSFDDYVAGRYLDRFERRGGVWKIAHRHAVYDWAREEPGTTTWWDPHKDALTFSQRGAGDVYYRRKAAVDSGDPTGGGL